MKIPQAERLRTSPPPLRAARTMPPRNPPPWVRWPPHWRCSPGRASRHRASSLHHNGAGRMAPAAGEGRPENLLPPRRACVRGKQAAGLASRAEKLSSPKSSSRANPRALIGREHVGGAVAHAAQQARDPHECADGVPRRRVVHKHSRRIALREPRVSPCRGIARERCLCRIAPARTCDEGATLPLALAIQIAHASRSNSRASAPASVQARAAMRRDRDEPCLFPLARREMHLKPVAGHDGAQLFRPFDQRDRARERVLDAKLVGVLGLTQSVEVEMPDRARRVLVELYQREGGASAPLPHPGRAARG